MNNQTPKIVYYEIVAEYIWIDAKGGLRSKCKTIACSHEYLVLEQFPAWNFDGSSTGQIGAGEENTEVILQPVMFCQDLDPARPFTYLVLCECLDVWGNPMPNNHRRFALDIFQKTADCKIWAGLEQEYIFVERDPKSPNYGLPLGWKKSASVEKNDDNNTDETIANNIPLPIGSAAGSPDNNANTDGAGTKVESIVPDGLHYCGLGNTDIRSDMIAREHYYACLQSGIQISGINAEVMPGQWEFQISNATAGAYTSTCGSGGSGSTTCANPVESIISICDNMWLARYLLIRIAAKYMVGVTFEPKPFAEENGSGCHINFSTASMRESNGIKHIQAAVERLRNCHHQILEYYGDNENRLTGKNETSSKDVFNCGVGTRHTSIRIPNTVSSQMRGYFEDRRPASDIDPYLAVGQLARLVLLPDQ